MHSSSSIVLLLGALASTALAYQQVSMPACAATQAPGDACTTSYTGTDTDGNPVDVVVNAFCGPVRSDGSSYCADNGAQCKTDDECYQWCGMGQVNAAGFGTCGGVGATCYDQGPNVENADAFVCNGPATTCSTNCDGNTTTCGPGTCLLAQLAPSQAAGMRKAKRVHRDFAKEARALMLRRAAKAVAMPGDEILS